MSDKTWTEIAEDDRAVVLRTLAEEEASSRRAADNEHVPPRFRAEHAKEAAAFRAAVAFLTSGPAEIALLTAERDAWARLAKARGKRLRMPSVVDPATSLVGEIGAEIRGACEALRDLGIDPKA